MKTSPFLVIKLWRKKKKKTFYASQKFNETPSTSAAPIQTRRSRVMHVEDKSKAFRQVVRKDQLAKLQEVRTAPEHWTQQNNIGRRRMMSPMRKNPELKSKKKTLFYEHFYHKTLGDLFRKISLLTTHSMNHNSREFTKCFSSPSHSILQITRTCALFLQMANEWKLPQFTTKATLRVSLWGVITIFEVRKVMGGLIKPFFSHLHKLIAPLQATIKWYWTETSTFTGSRRPGQMYMAWTSSSAWIKVAF